MPENLKGGSKAEELQDAIDTLSTLYDQLEEAEGTDVMLPAMR